MIDDRLDGADAYTLLQQLPLGYPRLAADDVQLPMALHDGMREAIDRPHRLGLQLMVQRIGGIDFLQGNLVQRVESEPEFVCQQAAL